MTPRPVEVAGLEELAEELERWSAYAHGAIDDARVRHRHVHERLRRASRSTALALDSATADTATLAAHDDTLARMAAECHDVEALLEQRREAADVLIAEARDFRVSAETAARQNVFQQERTASRVSTAMRDEARARAALHRSLELQREALRRRIRRGNRAAATLAQDLAEQEARRAAEALHTARTELAELRRNHEALLLGLEDLELDVAAAHDSLERLTTGLAAVRQAAAALEAAQRARTEAAHGVARVETLALAMDGLAQATTTRFERAELAQRKAEHQYEEGQRLATQVSRALRDRLAGFGDAQRERDRG